MKKTADLYVRVSTDEQAEKGYSQRNQEEMLRKYCEINSIAVRDVIYEDHSAKTFNRPKWKLYLATIKRYKNKTDLVLFTKWDRFSRNAGDAYQMINTLRRLGVEPQAIEQPLDLSIPENKMMLAFYLAAPEVENDRRALNTFHGMRRARKEGRYMGLAPSGYINKITEDGKKYITFDQPEASILKWCFEEIAKDIFNTEQIFLQAKRKGLKTSKNNFWRQIRNPLYCGKILIPKFKDEEAKYVMGSHEPLISEALFYLVQDVLEGRRKNFRTKSAISEPFPLKGLFKCPLCNKILTASISKGRNNHYSYYHCYKGCNYRIRSCEVNRIFYEQLQKYIPKPETEKIYITAVKEYFNDFNKESIAEKNRVISQLKEFEKKISYIRDLLASRKIEVKDYTEMKTDYDNKIHRLEIKLADLAGENISLSDLLKTGIKNLMKLNECCSEADLTHFRNIIGSIYPEKFTIEEKQFRTARINEVVQLVYLINEELAPKNNGTKKKKSSLSRQVTPEGFEPPTLRAEI
ncbi:recombinase family protein [Flavobacterium ginsenosidimutans]|uniref:Recombinase family protein n=1 Tax=Flavobacterium ginsenosidimutans TaxID=687844 RepID=A0ABZ2QED5_9FLAO